ncbi:hypothetical protein BDV12DRAFT_203080 [Aspergillus spectabilis]
MRFSIRIPHLVILAGVWLRLVSSLPDSSSPVGGGDPPVDDEFIMIRDVAIIGGGASGTYAAFRLWEENRSIILIEREGHLGGHTRTYYGLNGTRCQVTVTACHHSAPTSTPMDHHATPTSDFLRSPMLFAAIHAVSND